MRDEGLPYLRVERAILIPCADLERWMSDRVETHREADEIADEILRDL